MLIGSQIRAIQDLGLAESEVVARQIRGKLWELKLDVFRVFYVLITGPALVLLHAYRKKSRKAPQGEIEVAEQRMTDVLDRAGER